MSSDQQRSRVDDDDDLDDLDDVLDQFSPPPQPTAPAASAKAATSSQPANTDEDVTEDFAAKLAEEMESMLSGLGIAGEEAKDTNQARLAAAWEAMLVEGMDSMPGPSNARTPADGSSTRNDFQSHIRKTMNKLKESESGLKSFDPSATAGADSFEALLSQLTNLDDLPQEGLESEDQLQGVLEQMMGELMSKEVLYEPLKELHDKFPGYLTEHAGTISPEDKKRFEGQISCIKQLLDEFESKSYHDGDERARAKIVMLMEELQGYGSPPEAIMGPLPPGISMGSDGLPDMPDGCNPS